MNSPQLIIFEGADAAGKSTVCSAYRDALARMGFPSCLLSFPGKEPGTLGDLVYKIHHDPHSKGVDRLTSASLQALHVAAHLDTIESKIVPRLDDGQTVVLDRYWWSTWVYGVVAGADTKVLHALIEAERVAWGKWLPGLVYLIIRSNPLREEPLKPWLELCQEYKTLAERESELYPVCVLSNEGEIDVTVATALARSHGH